MMMTLGVVVKVNAMSTAAAGAAAVAVAALVTRVA
jgi:hypothetical protein